ncbi:MAG TPA: YicC family protein [Anaerohalosphaeraceae bacterium]|nr:YicC family protein [Phycisphaerae bacterium]HOK96444.1 YicC family protein [Anaerohalosphaeraceae bacterium]HOL30859.1 YicC family protein [Anaerohalosphaeraceae bacterium]HPC64968.1 YicC family protein [Anaerohalosphaeraceae bacterium]HRS72170.1 YicC family protein [Anaerohalosphaeraceae bacterium]
MIYSMTGFGQACAEVDGVVYTVEIRSVNNRFFKAQFRLPDIAAFLESEIERLHRDTIGRGTVSYWLRMKNISGRALFDIDENTLKTYIRRLKDILDEDDAHSRIDLASLLSLPGIVQPAIPDEASIEKMRQVIVALTQEALAMLQKSRQEEGRALAADLLDHLDRIAFHLDKIRQRVDIVVQEYHSRLKSRISQLLAEAQLKIDENLLAREVAIFAERSDIAEECSRLSAHLGQFRECCQTGGPVGRRLDFMAQEMLREANTISSKSSDTQISQSVIEIKCAIDRLKEQVQNVE